ncbi:MAG: MobC family plasmid mobilization relaxosome protein, partial [Mesorhizobium sp.]
MRSNNGQTGTQKASRRYGEVLHVRFSSVEMERLRALADGEAVTVSEVVRRLVRVEAGFLPAVTGELRPAIEEATDQLRRVGVNFNQAVRAINDGRVADDEDLERALIAVGELVRRFREELKAMIATPRK